MNRFEQELLRRSPLASAVLDTCDYVFDEALLQGIWDQHRGRTYEDVLKFPDFLRLMRDALVHHGGSAHKLFVDLESRDAQPVDESNFYRKLSRTPVALSRALLREGTQRLLPLLPGPLVKLPACFDGFELIAADGKTIKNAAKRLKPTRGFIGKLLGAKALVAVHLRSGLAVAMSDSLDAMSNEVPLVPLLMPQLHQIFATQPMLTVWDRQFDDLRTLGLLSSRERDAYLVRMKHKNMAFSVESSVESRDEQGRRVLDEIGLLGSGKRAVRVRRVTLFRNAAQGEDDVVLLTNLLDRQRYSAKDLLELYRHRWNIEMCHSYCVLCNGLYHVCGHGLGRVKAAA